MGPRSIAGSVQPIYNVVMKESAFTAKVQSAITDEIFYALGMTRRGVLRRGLGWVFALPTRIFARRMVAVDEAVGLGGPSAGCQKMLDALGVVVQSRGRSHLPKKGPAVLLANHPGAYDSMAIASLVPRQDLKVIVGRTRFFQVLPNIHPRLIYTSSDRAEGMLALRQAVDHLRRGGILLQFGSGLIEPDPALQPVDDGVFAKWSPSLALLMGKVPDTLIVPTIASGVLLARFAQHPLTRLRRGGMDQRRLAAFLQIIQQLLFPKTVIARPMVSFGHSFSGKDLAGEHPGRNIMPAVITRVKGQLVEHLTWINQQEP